MGDDLRQACSFDLRGIANGRRPTSHRDRCTARIGARGDTDDRVPHRRVRSSRGGTRCCRSGSGDGGFSCILSRSGGRAVRRSHWLTCSTTPGTRRSVPRNWSVSIVIAVPTMQSAPSRMRATATLRHRSSARPQDSPLSGFMSGGSNARRHVRGRIDANGGAGVPARRPACGHSIGSTSGLDLSRVSV